MDGPDEDLRMLRIERVLELIPVSRVSLYRMIKDGHFPKPVKLGGSSAWSNKDIRVWQRNLLASRDMMKKEVRNSRRRDLENLV